MIKDFSGKENIAAVLHKLSIGIYGFLLSFFIGIVLILSVLTKYNTNDYPYRGHEVFKNGWVDAEGKAVEIGDIDTSTDIYKVLNPLQEDKTLFLSVKTANVRVYLDGERIYDTELYDTWFLGSTPGYLFVEVKIPASEAERKLHVEIDNPYGDHSTKVDDIFLGESSSIISQKFKQLIAPFCLGVLMTVAGLIFIIMFFVLKSRFGNANKWFYIGVFALVTGIFITMDSKMLHLIYGHSAIWHIIIEISLMMIPIPMVLYFVEEFNLKKKLYPFIVISIGLVEIITNLLLNLANVKEFHETVFFTHGIFGIASLVGIHIVGVAMMKDFKRHIYDFIGLVIMLLGSLIDVIMYYTRSVAVTYIFLRIGVFGFLIFSGIQVVVALMNEYENVVKGDMIRRLAYHDGLTDLYNRTSFIEEMEALDKKQGECVLIAMFDVNNLKAVNDTLGHSIGDSMILSAANALSAGFSSVGKVYRIGGDEFVVIITGDLIREKFEKGLTIYEETIKEMNLSQKSFSISAAVGVESNVVSETCNAQNILEKADAAMYENKKEMKKGKKS